MGPRYKDINAKLRDYDRECRRDVDSEEPVRKVTVTISTPTLDRKSYKAPEPSYNGTSNTNGTSSYSNGTSSYKSSREEEDTTVSSAPKRGSWRKDIEAYEEKLTKNKPTPVINRNLETKEEPKEAPKVYSWQKSTATTLSTSSSSVSSVKSSSTTTTNYSLKTEAVKQTPTLTTAKIEEPKPTPAPTEAKPTPKWKKAEAKKEETKTEVKEEEAIAVAPVEEVKPAAEEENRLKPEVETPENAEKKEGEKKEGEGEEEEDHYGMKAMAKEEQTKFSAMDEEFAQGASKLSALRQKMKALRMKHKAAAEADAAAEAARQG